MLFSFECQLLMSYLIVSYTFLPSNKTNKHDYNAGSSWHIIIIILINGFNGMNHNAT